MHRHNTARRLFASQLFAAACICLLSGYRPAQLMADQSDTPTALADSRHYLRRYQATAYITLLSVSIFSRSGVGFGYARADEQDYEGRRDISLQFLSGSIPERAHGLNRFGFIQEDIKERERICTEASYFGLITANGEESLSQAKAALEHKSQTTAFVAAEATINGQTARYSIRHMNLSSTYRGVNAEQLLAQLRASFNHPEAGQPEHRQSLNGDVLGTFLYSLREAMLDKSDKPQKRFIYNGKTFRMFVEKRADLKVGQEFYTAGLLDQPSSAVLLTGSLHNEKTGEITNFRLWFDRTSPDLLPLRFEYRPKSYLRLVFQAVAASATSSDRIAAVARVASPKPD